MNWNIFKLKYDQQEEKAFEALAYLLFCARFENRIGLFRYKNQTGIETEPITIDGCVCGFQAKYYSTHISKNKADIIDSIRKSKTKNKNLNKILLYINQEFSESSKTNQKKPDYQISIENEAQNLGIEIIWQVPSHFEVQLTIPENKYIYDIFFGDNGLGEDFFVDQIEKEVKNLGPRFNENLNFELPIAKIFNSVSKNGEYHQDVILNTDKWLTQNRYGKIKDNALVSEIEAELEILRQDVKDWLIEYCSNNLVEWPITLFSLLEKIKTFNCKVSNKCSEIRNASKNHFESNKHSSFYEKEISRLREIQNYNNEFIDSIDSLNIGLANHPILIIQGEAGCGKSHLLGDIATQRKNHKLPTILLLGINFRNTTIENNILEELNLTCNFNDFLKNLNSIGLLINSRVLILIDGINEGAGADLWKNRLPGFIHQIAKFPAIGLVLTIRSTYFDDIISADLITNHNITIITHEGFKGDVYGALRFFCTYYNLKMPNFPILSHEFTNPLFLSTICEACKDLPGKILPTGFNGINKIFELYKQSLNKKFENKRPEYKQRNIVSSAIEKLAVAIYNTEYGQLEIQDAVDLFDRDFPKLPHLLSDLIEECVLMKTRINFYRENPRDIVFFSYQKLGDFFMAEELLKPYKTKEELEDAFQNNQSFRKITDEFQWKYNGIIEAFSISLPERYGLELFELINFFIDKNKNENNNYYIQNVYKSFCKKMIDSLKWREINSINEKIITNWLYKNNRYFCYDDWLYTLTELAAIPKHPFNGDRLHKILISRSMPQRDSFWQKHIRRHSSYDENNIAPPLQRLIDWAWTPNVTRDIDSETIRLVSQTLSWVLSSTNISLRDKTTKALVNLLEHHAEILLKTLKAFNEVDDYYILERLYAIAYGCILRTNNDNSIKIIAQYIYDTIFKNGTPPIHILLRDYARNAVEYAIYKNVKLDVNVKLIRPPYKSQFEFKSISTDELDAKYKPKGDTEEKMKKWGNTAILHSMTTEYGRGTCNYGDFGRYTFQSNISHWDVNADLLSNIAVELIFEKYGYNTKLHGEYDITVSSYSRFENKIERIGKKYQWIALYEILAILADNYKMKEDWWNNAKFYKGAWQLSVRNVDPVYISRNKNDEEDSINKKHKEWYDDEDYAHWDSPDSEWVKTINDLIDPKQIIEKIDVSGAEWLCLQKDIKWQEPKKIGIEYYEDRNKNIWYLIQSYLIKKKDKIKIIDYLKNKNFWGRWLPETMDDFSNLFSREKFWSPAYRDTYNNRLIWRTIRNTKYKVIVAAESANGIIEKDKSKANHLYSIPCKYIFEGMTLQYAPVDGNLINADGEVVVMNPKHNGVLIRKKDLIQFIEDNNLDIIWTLLGEKFSFTEKRNEQFYFKVPCGVYYLQDGKLHGELKMYTRN